MTDFPTTYGQAFATVDEVERIVSERVADASSTADELTALALESIGALASIDFNYDPGPNPAAPNIDSTVNVDLDLPIITPTSFGEIQYNLGAGPELEDVPDLVDLAIPTFAPSVTGLAIPEAPAPADLGTEPTEPVTGEVTLPPAPSVAIPDAPLLDDITPPVFAGLNLPVFNATLPTFEATDLPGILQWDEPAYVTEILDEVLAKIRALWAGGSGIPAAVENAMVERAMAREDVIAEREINSVATEFSDRGFTTVSGPQAARADAIRDELSIKKLGLNRELVIEFAKFEIENIRFAIQQGIAAENVLVNIHLNAAQRLFEVARYQVESQINIYNAQVAVFNARMTAYKTEADVFDIKVRAELAEIEVFKAEIDAEIAKGQINEQKVRSYSAQIQAVQTEVEVFKARMQGAGIESDVIRTKIESYKARVQAYAERINADKTRFEAYEARVRGEIAKAGVIDAEARGYAALIQGKVAQADIETKKIDLTLNKNRLKLEEYVAGVEAERTKIQAQLGTIQAGATAYTADTQRFAAVAGAETAKAQLQVSAKETELRTNIAFYQAQVQKYLGNMESLIRQASLIVDSLKAAGSLSATLAAGAMAGVHVGATLTGSGSVGAATSSSSSTSDDKSYNESHIHNYKGST